MPEFQLTTRTLEGRKAVAELSEFERGYITAALFTHGEDAAFSRDFEELAPETVASMRLDCAAFLSDPQTAEYVEADESRAGADFWYTRNRHGAGFWDGDWKEAGDYLTARARGFGELDTYNGDDGLIYT